MFVMRLMFVCLHRDKMTHTTRPTNGSGGGSMRGATVRVLLWAHLWPPEISVTLVLTPMLSVRDLSWIQPSQQRRAAHQRETKVFFHHRVTQPCLSINVTSIFTTFLYLFFIKKNTYKNNTLKKRANCNQPDLKSHEMVFYIFSISESAKQILVWCTYKCISNLDFYK